MPRRERAKPNGTTDLRAGFEQIEDALGERGYEIFRRRRLSGPERETLVTIGQELGITRERVRQLEDIASKTLDDLLEGNLDNEVMATAVFMRSRLGRVTKREDVERALRFLEQDGDVFSHRPDRVALLLHLAGPYAADDPWLTRGTSLDDTARALEEATEDGPLQLEEALDLMGSFGVPLHMREEWLARHDRFRLFGDELHRWRAPLTSKAVAILTVAGEPLELKEIAKRVGGYPPRNFAYSLKKDPRIRMLTKTHWGLAEWGGDEYLGVPDSILREIDRNGGSITVAEVMKRLADNYGISPRSVETYMHGVEFKLSKGVLSRETGKRTVKRKGTPLERTKRCFLLPEGWALRRTVTFDARRGSGEGMPVAFAKLIGLELNKRVQLKTPYQQINCTWHRHGPAIGSIKATVDGLGAVDGDLLFLIYTGEHEVDVRLVRKDDYEALEGIERLALECGRGRRGKAVNRVAQALDIDPKSPDVLATIRERLHSRREHDLLSLILE